MPHCVNEATALGSRPGRLPQAGETSTQTPWGNRWFAECLVHNQGLLPLLPLECPTTSQLLRAAAPTGTRPKSTRSDGPHGATRCSRPSGAVRTSRRLNPSPVARPTITVAHEVPTRIDFYRARVVDGLGSVVHEHVFAVETASDGPPRPCEPGMLGDLTPARTPDVLPEIVR